jgi:hypothetical protein
MRLDDAGNLNAPNSGVVDSRKIAGLTLLASFVAALKEFRSLSEPFNFNAGGRRRPPGGRKRPADAGPIQSLFRPF